MHARLVPAALALAAFVAPAAAQFPIDATGFQWEGASGYTAGPFCWGFNCTPESTFAAPGESGTLLVRGEWNALFVVAVSATATSCISIPGISNSLALDAPLFVAFTGTLDQMTPILSCPSGTKTIATSLPTTLIPGSSVAVQGLVIPVGGFAPPSFTQPIVLVIV